MKMAEPKKKPNSDYSLQKNNEMNKSMDISD